MIPRNIGVIRRCSSPIYGKIVAVKQFTRYLTGEPAELLIRSVHAGVNTGQDQEMRPFPRGWHLPLTLYATVDVMA
jgi:hypothetical protein